MHLPLLLASLLLQVPDGGLQVMGNLFVLDVIVALQERVWPSCIMWHRMEASRGQGAERTGDICCRASRKKERHDMT